MKHEWYIVQVDSKGDYIYSSPHAMSREDADILLILTPVTASNVRYEIMQTAQLDKLRGKS